VLRPQPADVLARSDGPAGELLPGQWTTLVIRLVGNRVAVWAEGRQLVDIREPAELDRDLALRPGSGAVSFSARPVGSVPGRFQIDYAAVWKLPDVAIPKK
jgi:hypothetical protein